MGNEPARRRIAQAKPRIHGVSHEQDEGRTGRTEKIERWGRDDKDCARPQWNECYRARGHHSRRSTEWAPVRIARLSSAGPLGERERMGAIHVYPRKRVE